MNDLVLPDQRRARAAWHAIQQLRDDSQQYGLTAQQYARACRQLPQRILTAGIGPALVFLDAKTQKRPILGQLHRNLTDWVIHDRLRQTVPELVARLRTQAGSQLTDQSRLLAWVIHGNAELLRLATDETLQFVVWLKRFAEAEGLGLLEDEGHEGEADDSGQTES